ncbi:programmed cell death 1 ligand 1-like [Mustelus asterias]
MRTSPQFNFLVLWVQLIAWFAVGFRVQTMKGQLIAIINQTILLECRFNITEDSMKDIVITWQRVETNEVVHSYYYGKDQLGEQNHQFSGRTSLFPEEFKNGNASLSLADVKPKDMGKYQCYVSNTAENYRRIISVTPAAFYNEPLLSIKQELSSIILTFESRGYPEADISWYNGDSLDVSFVSNCSYQATDGLCTIQSSMEVNVTGKRPTYTFVLRNAAVNQTISRTLTLLTEDSIPKADVHCHWYRVIISFILGAIFINIVLVMILRKLKYMNLEHTIPDPT